MTIPPNSGLPEPEGIDQFQHCPGPSNYAAPPMNWEGRDFQSCRGGSRKRGRALASEALALAEPGKEDGASRGIDRQELDRQEPVAPSTLMRWCKFNFVGGIGIGVQFVALFLLKSVLHFNYLAATAIAVESAVVHNFVWHEQFTWVDRIRSDRIKPDRVALSLRMPISHTSSPSAFGWRSALALRITCLKDLGLQPPSLRRFLRFNLTNGAVSILGNLALMKVMVGQGHMNYLLANAIAIAFCSLANFLVSDEWVFGEPSD
jgi:putative flippase GtrA